MSDRLWAPWRMKYISTIGKREKRCVLCVNGRRKSDSKNLVLFRSERCYIMLNLFPYNIGHLMVVPYAHTADLSSLDEKTQLDLLRLVERSVGALRKTLRPDGFNIGLNLGRAAGAGIDRHLHVHVVPRWNGDTNFMPVLGSTKVISEGLKESYKRLAKAFHAKA
jgi:ATP adenylyltransferase